MVYMVACPGLDGKCPRAELCGEPSDKFEGLEMQIKVETLGYGSDEEREWRSLYGRERP